MEPGMVEGWQWVMKKWGTDAGGTKLLPGPGEECGLGAPLGACSSLKVFSHCLLLVGSRDAKTRQQ